jgi:hypothetical protein
MVRLRERVRGKSWGLAQAREIAAEVRENNAAVRGLIAELFGEDVKVRKRAADVARGSLSGTRGHSKDMRMN